MPVTLDDAPIDPAAALFVPLFAKQNGTRKNVDKQAKMRICVQIVNKKCSTLFTKNRAKVVVCKLSKSMSIPPRLALLYFKSLFEFII